MLVLSRKPGEQIVVPELDLTLTVLSIQGGTVRLGVTAPVKVAVHRQEVWKRNQRPAATSSPRGLERRPS
jgi:carbon storage regulator